MKRKGTTLLELVIAMGIIIVGILTLVGLIVRSIQLGTRSKNELVALTLAQEGVEAVRSIRDFNYLEITSGKLGVSWNSSLVNPSPCVSNCDYTFVPTFNFSQAVTALLPIWSIDPLIFSVDAFSDPNAVIKYNETSGVFFQDDTAPDNNNPLRRPTAFRRVVAVVPICDDGDQTNVADGTLLHDDITNVNDQAIIATYFDDLSDWPACDASAPQIGIRAVSRVEWSGQTKVEDVIVTQDFYNWKQ